MPSLWESTVLFLIQNSFTYCNLNYRHKLFKTVTLCSNKTGAPKCNVSRYLFHCWIFGSLLNLLWAFRQLSICYIISICSFKEEACNLSGESNQNTYRIIFHGTTKMLDLGANDWKAPAGKTSRLMNSYSWKCQDANQFSKLALAISLILNPGLGAV